MQRATDTFTGGESDIDPHDAPGQESVSQLAAPGVLVRPPFDDIGDAQIRQFLEDGCALAEQELQPMLSDEETARTAQEAYGMIVENLRMAYRDVRDLDGEMHTKTYAEVQMFRYAMQFAIEECVELLRKKDIDINRAERAFHRLQRRLIDSYNVPGRYRIDGRPLLSDDRRTNPKSLRKTVSECFETQNDALYWIECARMDIDGILRKLESGIAVTQEQARMVYNNVQRNLAEAKKSMRGEDNAKIETAITHTRERADTVLQRFTAFDTHDGH